MIKKSAFFLLFVAAIALAAAGPSFAAASLNAGNTTLAAEKISASAAYPAANVQTAYQSSIGIAATQVLKLSITGAKFAGAGNIQLCDPAATAGTTTVGAGPISPDLTSALITLTVPLSNGTAYSFTNAAACNGQAVTPAPISNISIAAGTLAGTVVTLTVDNPASPGDPNIFATAPAISVINQFSAQLTPVTSKMNLGGVFPTATHFIPDVPAPTKAPSTPTDLRSDAAIVVFSNELINDKVALGAGGGACQRTIGDGSGTFTFKERGDFAGLTDLKYGVFAAPAFDHVITAAEQTDKLVTAGLTGAQILICGVGGNPALPVPTYNDTPVVPAALELTASGTAAIATGIRTATLSVGPGAAGQIAAADRFLVPATGIVPETSHIFTLNANRYYIPLVKVNIPAYETYIKFQSKSTIAGSNVVAIDILASDGTMVPFPAGSITSGTPLAITGTQLKDAVTAAGKSVDGVAGFAAIVNITSEEADIFPYANTCIGGTAEFCRRIPVKTVSGTIVE